MSDDFRRRAAQAIDSSWYFSWHWPTGPEWIDKAWIDANTRIERVARELADLINIRDELDEARAIAALQESEE